MVVMICFFLLFAQAVSQDNLVQWQFNQYINIVRFQTAVIEMFLFNT